MLQYITRHLLFLFVMFEIESACDKSLLTHKNYHLLNLRPNCGMRRDPRTASLVAPRIMNGTPGDEGEFPWMVHVEINETTTSGRFRIWCGGTLINNRHVLTCAHCLGTPRGLVLETRLMARLGQWKRSDSSNKVDVLVESFICHAGFDKKTTHNDICLLRLERTVIFNEFISPICLPLTCYWQEKDLECYDMLVAGWGYLQVTPSKKSPDEVQKLLVQVKSQQYCSERWHRKRPKKSRILESQICTEGERYKMPCPGDSGGPLMLETVIRNSSVYYLIGIVSGGLPCHRPGEDLVPPTIHTRINSFLKWILDHIRD